MYTLLHKFRSIIKGGLEESNRGIPELFYMIIGINKNTLNL